MMPQLLLTIGMGDIQGLLETAFYPALYAILVCTSLGLPLPEDIPLMAAGVLLNTHAEQFAWLPTIAVAMAAVLTGDSFVYLMARLAGPNMRRWRWMRRVLTAKRMRRAAVWFDRWGIWVCILSRFVVGLRTTICVSAAITKYPYWRFIMADGLGALLSVPLFIGLGYLFAHALPVLRQYLGVIQAVLIVLVAVAIIGIIIWQLVKARAARAAAEPA